VDDLAERLDAGRETDLGDSGEDRAVTPDVEDITFWAELRKTSKGRERRHPEDECDAVCAIERVSRCAEGEREASGLLDCRLELARSEVESVSGIGWQDKRAVPVEHPNLASRAELELAWRGKQGQPDGHFRSPAP